MKNQVFCFGLTLITTSLMLLPGAKKVAASPLNPSMKAASAISTTVAADDGKKREGFPGGLVGGGTR